MISPVLLSGLVACSESTPPIEAPRFPQRSCQTQFVYTPPRSADRVVVSGAFNQWSETAARMDEVEGGFELALDLRPGDHPYKLIVDGEWILDPANPATMFTDGVENSRAQVTDCARPELRVDHFRVAGGFELDLTFLEGQGASEHAPAALRIFVDGAAVDAAFDPDTRFFSVAQPLSAGKHRLRVEAEDEAGRLAPAIDVPFWVEATPFAWDGLMYFPMTDRFSNGRTDNDAPTAGVDAKANYHGGDLAGITQKIEDGYFEALGVDVVWLSPLPQNPDGAFSGADGRVYTGYHGYWPSEMRTPQPRFGTMDELRALTRAAHARGMRVIADLVLNHVHTEAPLYSSASELFNGDGSCVCGGPGCDWEEHKLDCWFAPYLADFDSRSLEVTDRLVDDAMFWLLEGDLDGFRVDAVKHFEKSVVRNLRARLERIESLSGTRTVLIGETFVGDDGYAEISEFVEPTQLDGQFDFPLYWSVLRTIARGESDFVALDEAVARSEERYPDGALMSPFVGNHDVPRLFSHAAGDIGDLYGGGSKEQGWQSPPQASGDPTAYERVALSMAFLLTQPGLPLIYYGDEIGLPGAGDPDNRRPMRFDGLSGSESSLLSRVRALGRLRQDVPALRGEALRTLLVEPDLYVYARGQNGEFGALVALNRGSDARTIDLVLPSEVSPSFEGGAVSRLSQLGANVESGRLRLTLPPRTAEIVTPL